MLRSLRILYVCHGDTAAGGGLTMGLLQQLGDCLGKGAFGSVYRALNWGTGETVAVKQIRLADLPKSELRVIMVRVHGGFTILSPSL
jgi:hypothetical protein